MKPVILAEEAEDEVLEASTFYSERSPRLGAEFTEEIERVLALLEAHPEIGTPVREELRRILLRRFPYRLLYRVEEDRVLVLVVAHQHRRPEYGQERM